MLEIEQKKQRDLVEELDHAKEELSKKEAELQASQMGSETDLSKSGGRRAMKKRWLNWKRA